MAAKSGLLVRVAVLVMGVAVATTGAFTTEQGAAQVPPVFTIEGALVFTDESVFPTAVRYSLRGHEYGNLANWQWWSIGAGGNADTATPTRELGTAIGTLPPRPDVALTRGGKGLAVWNELAQGEPTCGGLLTIQQGRIRFSRLEARLLPEQPASWSPAGVVAQAPGVAGSPDTVYLNPSVALDSIGRGLAIWYEVVFPVDVAGCPAAVPPITRIRYRAWDGQAWIGPEEGTVVPGSQQQGESFTLTPPERGFSTDLAFTSVRLDPGPPTGQLTRQPAIAVWTDFVGIGEEACPGLPSPARVHELWPRYAVWDGTSFSAATFVAPTPNPAAGAPFFTTGFDERIGVSADRSAAADLVFQTERLDTLCGGGPSRQVWSARWNPAEATFGNASMLADGSRPDVTHRTGDLGVAVYSGSVRTRSQTAPGTWGGETEIAAAADSASPTVAALPHGRTVAVWDDAGPLRFAEDAGAGFGSVSELAPAGTNAELAARPTARWAFLGYVGGDNNLEDCESSEVDQLERVGSSPDLAIAVEVDDAGGGIGLCDAGIGVDGTYRAQVVEHPAAGRASAQAPDRIENPAEPSMASFRTLADFLIWAREQYPADNYALTLYDHGDAWMGLVEDVTPAGQPPDWLDMRELQFGLAQGQPLRTLIFEMCRMAQIEVAYQVQGLADAMVASQDCGVEPNNPYGQILADLEANIGWNAEQLAADVVDRIAANRAGRAAPTSEFYTSSAIRLNPGGLANLAAAVDRLAGGLFAGLEDVNAPLDAFDNVQEGIAAARTVTHEPSGICFGLCPAPASDVNWHVDLVDLTRRLEAEARVDPAYKADTAAVRNALAAICFRERHGPGHGGDTPGCNDGLVNGLSIYFPPLETHLAGPHRDAFDDGSDTGTLYAPNPDWQPGGLPAPLNHPFPAQPGFDFPAATRWDEFLFRYYLPVADAGPDLAVQVGTAALLQAGGSSDADGTVGAFTWDLDPAVNSDAGDADRDGVDEADDDTGATGDTALFPCVRAGLFPVRLIVRDDHETIAGHVAHFNVDDDTVLVNCSGTGAATDVDATDLNLHGPNARLGRSKKHTVRITNTGAAAARSDVSLRIRATGLCGRPIAVEIDANGDGQNDAVYADTNGDGFDDQALATAVNVATDPGRHEKVDFGVVYRCADPAVEYSVQGSVRTQAEEDREAAGLQPDDDPRSDGTGDLTETAPQDAR